MLGYGVALRGEIYLARRSTALRTLLVLALVASLARVGFAWVKTVSSGATGEAGVTGTLFHGNAYGPFVDGLSSGLLVGGLLLLVISAGSLAWDREHGIVRLRLTLSVSRSALVMAKITTLALTVFLLLAVVILSSWGAAAFFYDFGPVVEDGYEIFSAGEIRGDVVIGVAAAATPLIATLAFGLLVSVCARTAAQAIATALVSFLVFDAFKGLLGEGSRWVFASYQPSLVDRTYLREVTWKVARGFSDITYKNEELWYNFTVPLAEALLFLALALLVARRRRM